jgi:hypothetical protein
MRCRTLRRRVCGDEKARKGMVTPNVFRVNIDAVIAALLSKTHWQRCRSGAFSEEALESAAFTAFLFGRMAGCAGEIDDHINRGRNMDARTPASQCSYVV